MLENIDTQDGLNAQQKMRALRAQTKTSYADWEPETHVKHQLTEFIFQAAQISKQKILGAFYPEPRLGEPQIEPFFKMLKECENKGVILAFPKILDNNEIAFYPHASGSEFSLHPKFSVREPVLANPAVLQEVTPDVVLTPALILDSLGNRIGRGGGFYDRLILRTRTQQKTVSQVLTKFIGIVHPDCWVDRIPDSFLHSKDQTVDAVTTAKSFFIISKENTLWA